MTQKISVNSVPVNYGALLENQLKKWKGGGHHSRGIAEYISNSDDSYRRLNKFTGQEIIVELHTRTGKKIEKLIIKDHAEGMSYEDLEQKFFRYFESFSGRDKGEKVTGRFGTGGKAYAIMNFRQCWIISVKDGKECKAWFQWDHKNLEIIKGYDGRGYKDKPTTERNGTTVVLLSSIKVNLPPKEFVNQLENLPRIRHVLRNQKVNFKIIKSKLTEEVQLVYVGPNPKDAKKTWKFTLPDNLKNNNGYDNNLILRFFEKPLADKEAFIELSDGISSVADLLISEFDKRPFSKYVNGNLTITQLVDSVAVKENRRGLEEGDDLTEEIKTFIKESVKNVIDEIEMYQKELDKERRIDATNEKFKELSKFLSKQDLRFKQELSELRKRFSKVDDVDIPNEEISEPEENENPVIYRKPLPEDNEENLIRGKWVTKVNEGGDGSGPAETQIEFIPDDSSEDLAVKVGMKKRTKAREIRKKQGLQVLPSNDHNNPDSPTMSKYDDPVSDRDMVQKGIIWINVTHPIIDKIEGKKGSDKIRFENIANYVLMMIAQYYTQKELELQPIDEREDSLMLFRKHFFKLQMDLRLDEDNSFFDDEDN